MGGWCNGSVVSKRGFKVNKIEQFRFSEFGGGVLVLWISCCILLQGLLHHLFVRLIKHVMLATAPGRAYSMEVPVELNFKSQFLGRKAASLSAHFFLLEKCAAVEKLCGPDATIFEHYWSRCHY